MMVAQMKPAWKVVIFAVRHVLMIAAAMMVGCVMWTLMYALLLFLAVIFGLGRGGPLAYPAGIIAILLTCLVAGVGVFAPACAIGAMACAFLKWPRFAAIPIVAIAAFGLCYALTRGYVAWVPSESMPSVAVVLKNFVIFMSIPLGGYWWVTEGPGAIVDALRRWLRRRRHRTQAASSPVIEVDSISEKN
jgi:hypothetical protein